MATPHTTSPNLQRTAATKLLKIPPHPFAFSEGGGPLGRGLWSHLTDPFSYTRYPELSDLFLNTEPR